MLSGSIVTGLLLLGGSLGVLALGYFWWMRRFLKKVPASLPAGRVSPEAMEALERRIGGKIPKAIRQAYLDGSVERVGLPAVYKGAYGEEVVHALFGADAEVNERVVRWHGLPASAFVFGGDDFGNYFLVKANEEAVYFWGHESGEEAWVIAAAAREFWDVVGGGGGG